VAAVMADNKGISRLLWIVLRTG